MTKQKETKDKQYEKIKKQCYLEDINFEVNEYINRLTYHLQRCSQQFANEVYKINAKYFEMKEIEK